MQVHTSCKKLIIAYSGTCTDIATEVLETLQSGGNRPVFHYKGLVVDIDR